MRYLPQASTDYKTIRDELGQVLAKNVDLQIYRSVLNIPEAVSDKAVQLAFNHGKGLTWLEKYHPEELV